MLKFRIDRRIKQNCDRKSKTPSVLHALRAYVLKSYSLRPQRLYLNQQGKKDSYSATVEMFIVYLVKLWSSIYWCLSKNFQGVFTTSRFGTTVNWKFCIHSLLQFFNGSTR